MKKALLAVLAVALIFGLTGLKCDKDEIVSVTLDPIGELEKNIGDTLVLSAETDPEEVDKVMFTGIDVEVTELTEGKYVYEWVLEEADVTPVDTPLVITAMAYLGENELESEDALTLTVVKPLPTE